ncbi:NUDIX hydrolase [Calditrichota bacterium GD2]
MTKKKIIEICSDSQRLISHIKQKLADYQTRDFLFRKDVAGVPAAVLFPLFFKDSEPYLLFTRRTDKVEHHKNQISLPGGRKDDEDADLLQTALRETEEEIGVKPKDVQVLGQTDRFLTNTYYLVTPFVGVIPYPYNFKISESEIDYLIEAPLLHLLDEKNFETKIVSKDGVNWLLHYYHYQNEVIWGVTGFLLSNFFSIVFGLDRNRCCAAENRPAVKKSV